MLDFTILRCLLLFYFMKAARSIEAASGASLLTTVDLVVPHLNLPELNVTISLRHLDLSQYLKSHNTTPHPVSRFDYVREMDAFQECLRLPQHAWQASSGVMSLSEIADCFLAFSAVETKTVHGAPVRPEVNAGSHARSENRERVSEPESLPVTSSRHILQSEGGCPATCMGENTCNTLVMTPFDYTCDQLTQDYGCDCGGCAACSSDPAGCPATCFGYSCDFLVLYDNLEQMGVNSCAELEILYGCDCGGCGMCESSEETAANSTQALRLRPLDEYQCLQCSALVQVGAAESTFPSHGTS
ncbi:hypothetical protein CYMTET_11025 [Cymbomonas tetramitiformis]|uniref:Uncharacterized protein n=1 Tax=Cymbomonas tetramitiformis TaxID=36881 RepID=A0AAE0LD86_9CHLO|nr:hypothetical protein CYMTET_11025 [Cymbomonas tetramitiformis]